MNQNVQKLPEYPAVKIAPISVKESTAINIKIGQVKQPQSENAFKIKIVGMTQAQEEEASKDNSMMEEGNVEQDQDESEYDPFA